MIHIIDGGKPLKIITLTGMPGSGKEEFVKVAFGEDMTVIRMGDVVRQEVERRGLELTDANVGNIAASERESQDLGIWARRTLPLVKGEHVLIDGVRGDAELDVFRSAFGNNLAVIGIHASPAIRFQRIKERKRRDATLTWEEFRQRDLRELAWGLGNAIALCDFMLVNEGSLEEFQNNARKLVRALK